MATKNFTAGSTWTKITDAGSTAEDSFLLRKVQPFGTLLVATSASQPTTDKDAVQLTGTEAIIRVGDGDLYVKSFTGNDIDFTLMG